MPSMLFLWTFLICFLEFGQNTVQNPVEDTSFWMTSGERRLQQVLEQLSDEGNSAPQMAKNIIIFIGDGMGMASITAGRIFKGQQRGGRGEEENLEFDAFPHIGLAKTYNVNKQVPDSAGTATALFSGVKTNYGFVGMDSISAKTTSIMDWAQAAGKRTGFVTTTRVTHATPAALYAHTPHRFWECYTMDPTVADIGRQLIETLPGAGFDVILGGGRIMLGANDGQTEVPSQFRGAIERSCARRDSRNLVEEWLTSAPPGTQRRYIRTAGELLDNDFSDTDQLLGLFAGNHMSFSSVRDQSSDGEPSLAEMTVQALRFLQRNGTTEGFVLMVEGGRIDQAHHQNHARLALEEIVELDAAIAAAMAITSRTDTLILVTADHSHAMTFNGYPERGNDILGFGNVSSDVRPYETLTYANGPGFWRHRLNETDGSPGTTTDDISTDRTWRRVETMSPEEREAKTYQHRAMMPLEDETHGGEDVPVYACGPGAQLIRGAFEQNYVAHVMSYVGCMGPAQRLNANCV